MFKKVIGGLVAAMGLLSGSIQYSVSAQSKYMDQYCMPDPQVWGMIKYSGQTPDLYTGTVRAEIPIYTYSDPDFEIPVSLTYASNGYMPNTQANFVGLGWSLNAGGCITRRVQGERDEIGNVSSISGYYDYVSGGYSSEVGYDADLSAVGNTICYQPSTMSSHYETEPDIFMFSFLGYSGKFMISPSGEATVFDTNIPSGEITIDLSGFNQSWPSSYIKIKTGDSYEYTFGSLEEYVNNTFIHYTTCFTNDMNGGSQSYNMDNSDSWYLKEIKAPNGRTVSFSYLIGDDTAMQLRAPGASYSTACSGNVSVENAGSIFTRLDESWTVSSHTSTAWFLDRTMNLTLPTSIDIDGNFEITFSYTDREKEKGYLFRMLDDLYTPVKLSKVKAVNKAEGSEIMTAVLDYIYPSSGNRVLMLEKVNLSGLGEYRMEYYNQTNAFPYLGSCAVDHWGYYNSSSSTDAHSMVPTVNLDNDYVEHILSASRNPDPEKSLTGMLKSLRYPTGGYTKYSYEPHKYGKSVVRNSLTRGRFHLEELQSEYIAGGLRIKEIVDSASTGVVSRRTYEYECDEGGSSGIMMDFPRYCMSAIKDTILNGQHIFEYLNIHSSSCPGYLLDGNYIGYSSVRETYGDGSSKVTNFTSWEDFPDVLDDNDPIPSTEENVPSLIHIEYTYPNYFYNIIRIPTSAGLLRGKVKSVKYYDADRNLLQAEAMRYDADWDDLEYMKSVKVAADSIYIHHTLCDVPRLISRTVTCSSGVVRTEEYEYNAQDQLKSSRITNNPDSKYTTYYFYPQDIASSDRTTEEQEMVENNVISEPVYVVNTHKRGAVEKIVSAVHTIFDKIGSSLMPMFVKGSEHIAETVSDQSVVSSAQAVLDKVKSLPYKTLFTWNEYNSMGRPCHVTDTDGVSSLIIWGYDGLYPVALLRNVTPSLFDSTVHSTGAYKTVMGWNGLSAVNESTFRGIKNSAVTVWGWKPFVGMTKVTGPDSRTMTYSYDSFGRLESVTGSDGNINSKYTYKLK